MERPLRIGILALQGCVEPHVPHLNALGVQVIIVRSAPDFANINALILPGGESTVQLKLLGLLELEEVFLKCCSRIPVWGICAGAILMALNVSNPPQKSYRLIDIDIERNSYGRQLDSFRANVGGDPVAFIRAPLVTRVGAGVTILESFEGIPVWLSNEQHMITTFHPELGPSFPSNIHRYFVERALRNSELSHLPPGNSIQS